MAWVRRGYELAFPVLGRPVRPFHLATAVSTGTVAVANLAGQGIVLSGDVGTFVGIVAAVSAVFLTVGWWWQNDTLAEWGLLLAAGAWASRATFVFLTSDTPWAAAALSSAWVIGAAGAYILERYDHRAAAPGDG